MSGLGLSQNGTSGGVVTAVTTDVTIANSTTETTLATLAVPTSAPAASRYRFIIAGDILNNSAGAVNYTFKVKLGATTVLTASALSLANSATRRQFSVEGDVYVVAPASDQRVRAVAVVGTTSSNNFSMANINVGPGYGTAAEDLTAGKNLLFTVQLGTADANADCRVHLAVLSRG